MPAHTHMQGDELLAQVLDHFVHDIREIQKLASRNILRETDGPCETPCDGDAAPGACIGRMRV